jgi:VIT1/CCC1 family predicted Fe2+/Mn2+ transporter
MMQDNTHEQHDTKEINDRLNWLRAAVLGANDGIVSVAGLVVGVAGATTNKATILTAGIAGMVAGALSMAVGEYVSVSSQKDAEKALIEKERYQLKHNPDQELKELAVIYEEKGLSPKTAKQVATELTEHDPIKAHLEAELGIKEDELTNPRHAAIASGVSFTFGAAIPVFAIVVTNTQFRVPAAFVAVAIALMLTGFISARLGSASARRATARVLLGGFLAMIITYGVGTLSGIHV